MMIKSAPETLVIIGQVIKSFVLTLLLFNKTDDEPNKLKCQIKLANVYLRFGVLR